MPNIKFSLGTIVETNKEIHFFSFGKKRKKLKRYCFGLAKPIDQCIRVYLISEKRSTII